jgi:hypothetical protein
MADGNWYLKNKSKIMREVRLYFRSYRKHLAGAYGKPAGEALASDALGRFEVLLPDIPYIGGDENRLTKALYTTAAMLAMYRSLQERGASVEEAARLIYLGTASFYNGLPMRWLMRWGVGAIAARSDRSRSGTPLPSARHAAIRTTGCSRSSRATGRTSTSDSTTPSADSSSIWSGKVPRNSLRTCAGPTTPCSAPWA